MDIEQIWDFLVGSGIATEDELRLIVSINGYSTESLNDVLYCRTGCRSIEQLKESN